VTQHEGTNGEGCDRPLKVVHLATTDFGGAGRAAYRLHRGLLASGVDSTMLVVTRKSSDPSVRVLRSGQPGAPADCPQQFPPNADYARRVMEHWSALVADYPQRDPGMDNFSDDLSEIPLECSREIREADIVNLHWVSGIFNCFNAARALRGKKIVWTMHDMNPFTGGCHYAGECTGYLRSCGSCPMLGSRDESDISRTIWQLKQYGYGKLDLHPVAPSRWLAGAAQRSSLFSRFQVRVIPNGFPTDLYAPTPGRQELRESFGIPPGAKVVLFGAESLLIERKGFAYLLQALKGMATQGIVLAFFGRLPEQVQLALDLPLVNLGFVEDEAALAARYAMADLFVIPSLEDNLPNTVVEAMLCGVPVAGFDIGGIPDMVEHLRTGYLAPPRNVSALIDGINWCLFHPEAAGAGARGRARALERYSLQVQAANYGALYRELLAAVPPMKNRGEAERSAAGG
jgi:glycosyltransferase involved in cell wall biosynthesis